MKRRIFRAIVGVALLVCTAASVLMVSSLFQTISGTEMEKLRDLTALAARDLALEGEGYLSDPALAGYRITWVDGAGRVLYDSAAPADTLENHLNRQEIRDALETGTGESRRYSDTRLERLLYTAVRLPDGTVLRLAAGQQALWSLAGEMVVPALLTALVALVLSCILGDQLAQRIVEPLDKIDFSAGGKGLQYPELNPFFDRIRSQQQTLFDHAEVLRRKQDEFEQITGSMSEGLVLLNRKGQIISMNRAAARLFSAPENPVGAELLALKDTEGLRALLHLAQEGERGEALLHLVDREYQVTASPIITQGRLSGVALLLFDASQRARAEQMRREFTANVSHELKTPLHSISGCAELLKNGMVQPEDVPSFAGQIYGEAQRMIRLVSDILRLSRLDEGTEELRWEETCLRTLAREAVERFASVAEKMKVTLELTGGEGRLVSIPQHLAVVIHNLVDNAIKYNRPGGRVTIRIGEGVKTVSLTVEDTGIGIEPRHQARIFERFYRVDKSHSKAVGGTGLGLSITKHTVRVLGGTLHLVSTPGEGTRIAAAFPRTPGEEPALSAPSGER